MAKVFANWAAFAAHLDDLGLFRMEPGLERIGLVLGQLRVRRLSCPTVQVVGTNGKGSTSTFLASLSAAHGRKAGLYTSPHFVTVRERLRIFSPNGSPWGELLPEERWLEATEAVLAAGGESLTYFELVTAMCAWLLCEEGVEVAVLESGLGGSYDAVSAMESDVLAFTPIALDHCSVLGNTLEEITRDKAGAMRQASWARSATQEPKVRAVLQEEAAKRGVDFAFADPELLPAKFRGGMSLGLQGGHQVGNAALALSVWRLVEEKLFLQPNSRADEQGLSRARIPGRMQFIQPGPHPPLIVDGAHNAHGLAALGRSLAQREIAPAAIIFNCMRDKEPEKLITHLRVLSTGQIFVPEIKDNPRAMPAAETAALIGLAATPVRDITEAIYLAALSISERLPEERNQDVQSCKHPLLICGSLYLLGEFFTLYPQYLTKDSV